MLAEDETAEANRISLHDIECGVNYELVEV
jgi:hypothetical protein